MAKTAAAPAAQSLVTAGWVIDASATMPWFFADKATPFTEKLLDALGEQPLWAPTLWVLECANVLQSAQRRRRLDAQRRSESPLSWPNYLSGSTTRSRSSLAWTGSLPRMA